MSLQKSQDRHFFGIDGQVLTSGGSLDIKNGTIAIVNTDKSGQNGQKVVSAFNAEPKGSKYQIKMGVPDKGVSRDLSDKSIESLPFTLDEVEDFKVFTPKEKGLKVDDFIIGWNGKAGTEIVLKANSSDVIELELCGEPMYMLGYTEGKVVIPVYMEYPYVDEEGFCAECANGVFTMQEVIERAVKQFKKTLLLGQVPITEYVDISIVNSESPAELEGAVAYSFYDLVVKDGGTKADLARVQFANPTYDVKVTNTTEDRTTYTIVAPAGLTIADFVVTDVDAYPKGCEDCAAGYTELADGFVYSIQIEDDGTDVTTSIDDVPNFVTGTVVKQSQNAGVGTYTVVTSVKLTDAQIVTYQAVNALKSTAVFNYVGEVTEVCREATTTTYTWTETGDCSVVPETYTITLADDECGDGRLAELQAFYPNLTIAIDTVSLSQTLTFTGTGGTANVRVGGVNYLATFATDLSTTRANFVTAHKTAIELATGGVLTGTGATITLVTPRAQFKALSITNVTTNLAGTVASAVGAGGNIQAACQTTYRTTVLSDVKCEECDPVMRDLFTTEAPASFDGIDWEKAEKQYSETAKMGIRFRGKEVIFSGSEAYMDEMPFIYTSTRISVAGGSPDFVNENFVSGSGKFAVKLLQRASDPEALGGNLRDYETRARTYFEGETRLHGNNYGKWVFGHESRLKGTAQYVDYALTINHKKHYQLFASSSEKITYHFTVELGRNGALENLLNKLATASGLPAQKAIV
jgi:hypothetical protein